MSSQTIIKWINQKISISSDTPTIDVAPVKTLTDLSSGLVLIKLANQVVYEILGNNQHPLHKEKLYYLHPIYQRPNFKLQKMENLEEFLKFARLILNLNVLMISAENIHDGDSKLVLGFLWSIYLLNNATMAASSFSELKSILSEWFASRGFPISSFVWTPAQAERVFCGILKREMQLQQLVQYAYDEYSIPKYIETEQDLLDEKSVVTYSVEWYKCFAYKLDLRCNSAVLLVVNTARLKNRYETKALRFINRANRYLAEPDEPLYKELVEKDFPELEEYINLVVINLDQVGILYYPSIKPLGIELIREKMERVQDAKETTIENPSEITCIYTRLQKEENEVKMGVQKMSNETQKVHSVLVPTVCSASEYSRFTELLAKHSLLSHYDLCKFLKTEVVTTDLEPGVFDGLVKLIPKRSICVDHDFKLTSSSSQSSLSESPEDEKEFIFDEVQQRLDGQLLGNADKVYDLGEFIGKLSSGFHI